MGNIGLLTHSPPPDDGDTWHPTLDAACALSHREGRVVLYDVERDDLSFIVDPCAAVDPRGMVP